MDNRDVIKTALYNHINSLASQCGGLPDKIALSVYEDDDSLRFFRQSEQWDGGNAEHTAVMKWLAEEVERDFPVKVELRKIITSDYWRWLAKNGRKDGADARAEYIS